MLSNIGSVHRENIKRRISPNSQSSMYILRKLHDQKRESLKVSESQKFLPKQFYQKPSPLGDEEAAGEVEQQASPE